MANIQIEWLPKNALAQATIGPAFIGFIISMYLRELPHCHQFQSHTTLLQSMLGISIVQIIFYYCSFPGDGRVKKSIVLLLGFAFSETIECSYSRRTQHHGLDPNNIALKCFLGNANIQGTS
ncbi:hypothetical protein FIBSPDRAFT_363473 [Athelia psychrophila]|uniref:Uncharacterized protein n=1 Tax=Athelia psychrophila TaxID=1759441 RepID=A0A166PFA4_9AGAM|nr:hypothetical protein FIBSPDRAFT_363473 [Fibularhizoctonia sp. CBS 109695]